MILEGDNSHAFIYLFIHSFQKKKKISPNPHYAFGTGPGNEETKVSHTRATELTAQGPV